MYNNYAAIHGFWSDTTDMDNLRGGDDTGLAIPGSLEVNAKAHTGYGNTVHTYSSDDFYSPSTGSAAPGNPTFYSPSTGSAAPGTLEYSAVAKPVHTYFGATIFKPEGGNDGKGGRDVRPHDIFVANALAQAR